jgi:uncharacterized protein (DUF924 family)
MAQGKRWFRGGPEMDAEVLRRFGPLIDRAVDGGLEEWLAEDKGWLALIILLDQLTRNAYRGKPRTYDGDGRARKLALAALDDGRWEKLPHSERHFAMMPLLHAEDLPLQERSVQLMDRLMAEASELHRPFLAMGVEQAHKYRGIIARFGRFPHRNGILGRTSTSDEIEFLRENADKMAPSGAAQMG